MWCTPMVETQNPSLLPLPGKLLQLTDLPDPPEEERILVQVEVQVENGVLPPARAPTVKTAKPATPQPERGNDPAPPAPPAEKPEG